ncbi:hypothetical protein [Aquabacterium sp.]|uniref:hypothetical protein n=1 Tax=Aquabacterium sp. TaxID=1872578 RepID=UPI002486FB57|nr:hypothetical protein [Aquabacterium sp.]MDI1259527.1 hypothetical protein [Aquabacterium sp.]
MDIKFALSVSLLWASASACASGSDIQHGIIKLDGAGHASLIVAAPLVAGQTVYFQYPDAKQQPVCCKRLTAQEFAKADGADTLATNEVTGNPPVIYHARLPKLWAEMPFVGAATIGQSLRAEGAGRQLFATTRQGHVTSVETCTSQEGVHLMATHLYLGLGYEVEQPTCR